jgi:quaternary ammonium compound-resistance protein SugE
MEWIYLFIAAAFEIGWAVSLKYTEGFSKLYPTIVMVIFMVLSFYFLSQAVKNLPIGTGYAVWTGTAVIGTAILGVFLFNEPYNIGRVVCIMLIATGIVGLKFISG